MPLARCYVRWVSAVQIRYAIGPLLCEVGFSCSDSLCRWPVVMCGGFQLFRFAMPLARCYVRWVSAVQIRYAVGPLLCEVGFSCSDSLCRWPVVM